ncbi:MAG: hypothetical protein ACO3K2_07080 [Nitrosopumilaceae archaeon]
MEEKKPSKIRDIKETASDAVEIMRHIGTPGVIESLTKVKETAKVVNEIIQNLNSPEMVKNIENFRLISENMDQASTKMEKTVNQLRDTGMIEEMTEVIKFAKGKIDSPNGKGINTIMGQDLREVSVASKEMLLSIKDLVNEITVTVGSSKKAVFVGNVKETIRDSHDIYKSNIA